MSICNTATAFEFQYSMFSLCNLLRILPTTEALWVVYTVKIYKKSKISGVKGSWSELAGCSTLSLLFIVHLIASISSVAEENFFNALQNSEHVLGKQHRVTQIIQKNLIVLYQTNEKFNLIKMCYCLLNI
jgi:hypothetical protein